MAAAVAAHVLAALAVWLLARQSGGLLPNSDELYIVSKADAIVAAWREGRLVQWRDITFSETNPGYYYLVASVRFFVAEELLVLRLLNVGLGLAAIWIWRGVLQTGGESRGMADYYLVAALWIPSPMLWSALILKEAAMYALLAFHVLAVARILRRPRPGAADLAWYALSIALLSCFRNYAALLVLALSVPVLIAARGMRFGAVSFLAAAVAALLLNPYALTLFAYKATGGWMSFHAVDWLLGQSELVASGLPGTAAGEWTADAIRSGTSTGAAAIPPATPLWRKAWLFLSFPLPWQATSPLQKIASPEAVAILLALPVVAAGALRKLRERDLLAGYIVLLTVALAAVYITFVNNLGTLYRIKSSLLLPAMYFGVVGARLLYSHAKQRR